MRKVFTMLCLLGLLIVMLLGWFAYNEKEEQYSAENESTSSQKPVTEQTAQGNETINNETHTTEPQSVEDEIIINTVHVTEQPLSEIITEESDIFAKRYNVSQPYFDGDNDMYYYRVFVGDSASDYLYYDNGVDEPINADVPEIDDFKVHIIIDGAIYGIEYDRSDWYSAYITRYKNGVGKRLTDEPVEGCYFAEEGIYYQTGNKIKMMDYSGKNSKLIVEIPLELYYESATSKFIVYRGNLWYGYDEYYKEPDYPLWCYDFDGTFTTFDRGGIDAVNNGFIYYQEPHPADQYLYRFNCETYTVERVSDSPYIYGYAFLDNYIFFISWDSTSNTSYLYRMNLEENKRILSPEVLGHSNDTLLISCTDNRIFVTGAEGMFYTCLAEIDIDGNIIEIIHEDKYW